MVAVYPASSFHSFAFLACPLFPLFPALEQKSLYGGVTQRVHIEEESLKKTRQTPEVTVRFPYLSFSCIRTPAIRVFREVCV